MDPIEQLVNILVSGYALIVAYLFGWATPRGNALRMTQLWILRKIHNFLAWEDEKVVEAIETTKDKIRKQKR